MIVSSPDEVKFSILSKDEAGTIKFYMDLWNEEEVVRVANVLLKKGINLVGVDLSEVSMRERFKKFGGSARAIFSPDSDFGLEEAIQKANTISLTDLFSLDKRRCREGRDRRLPLRLPCANLIP